MAQQAELLEPRELGADRRGAPRHLALLGEPLRANGLADLHVALHHAAQEQLLSLADLHDSILAGSVLYMDVVIAGGHGNIALRLTRLLSERGDRVRGLIRNPDHAGDVEAAGGEPVICDIEAEDDISAFVAGADAAVFAAGAGPGSGAERKRTVDYGAAVKLIDACRRTAHRPLRDGQLDRRGRPVRRRRADAAVPAGQARRGRGADGVRPRLHDRAPGSLTDDPATGRVTVTTDMSVRDRVTREDVAAVLAAALRDNGTIGKVFVVVGGETPIDEALRALS